MFYTWNCCRGMAGPKLTAADIVAYPGLKLLLRASQRPEAAPLELGLDGFNTLASLPGRTPGGVAPRL
jgi:hypothetical protein